MPRLPRIAWLGTCLATMLLGSDAGASVVVFVSVPPQASLVRQIGGEHVRVQCLVPAGQDPHLFNPSLKELRSLGQARLYFTVGIPFEKPVLNKIRGHLPNMMVVDSAAGLTRRAACDCGHDHAHSASDGPAHGHGTSDGDPHVWLSPAGLRIMARNMAAALARVDPSHKEEFEQRLKKLLASIDAVDAQARRKLAPYRGRSVYVFHPAFGYFCDAYGLVQKAVEVDGKPPNLQQLRGLIRQAGKDRARVIFVQGQFDQRRARVVAESIGARLVAIDPLAEDAVANLGRIADAIASGMEARRD